jgi:hypothetical protein
MKLRVSRIAIAILSLVLTTAAAQSPASDSAVAQVPPVIQFSNIVLDRFGNPLTGEVVITFALYNNAQGGEPLWSETQNIELDSTGHYSVYLGITKAYGLPTTLFTTGQAHWLGVKVAGQEEQTRVFLVSVPYAMKAGDAATVGGLPPSAFVLAAPPASGAAAASVSDAVTTVSSSSASPLATSDVTTTGGTANTFPLFTTATNVQNSILTQTGTTAINVGGKLNLPALGTATSGAGFNSRPLDFVASVNNGTTAVQQTFQWQAEALNNDSTAATGTLNLLYASGTAAAEETGLKISSKGLFTFASGQTFPGAGTITGITTAAGSGLMGGGTTGALDLALTNTCATNQVLHWTGTTWACAAAGTGTITGVTAGTDLTGGGTDGTVTLNLDTTKVPLLAAANTFTGNQTVDGNLSATGLVTGSGFEIGSNPFDYGSYTNGNAFLGFAGSGQTTGTGDTASGFQALYFDTTGSGNSASGWEALAHDATGDNNTASGYQALYSNSTGNNNTATGYLALVNSGGSGNVANGYDALYWNTTGNNNTAVGYDAGSNNGNYSTGSNNTFVGANTLTGNQLALSNATAIGANAEVLASNALVLGSINGVNNATANTDVGIGTTTPGATLDVEAPSGSTPTVNFGSASNPAALTVNGTGSFTGLISFASGQIFPGTGTITGVTAGSGLSGGGSSGAVTLTNSGILALTGGTGISIGSGQSPTIGVNQAQVPLLTATNNFTANQTVTGNLSLTGSYQIGGVPFAFGSTANGNAFLGFGGNTSASGTGNTAAGYTALVHGSGSNNTGVGLNALYDTTTGGANTAVGSQAGGSNSTGSANTFIGYSAGSGSSTPSLINATAIGAYATVAQSNSLVLGSIAGVNGASTSVNVGIGTAAPTVGLDVDNGIMHVSGNTAPVTVEQGAYLGWNASGGTGETDLINNQGLGTGGFAFINTPASGSPPNTLMTISGSGNMGVNGSVSIGGDTPMTSNPHMSFSGMFIGSLCNAAPQCGAGNGWGGGGFVPDRNIEITRIIVTLASTIDSSCLGDGGVAVVTNSANYAAYAGTNLQADTNYIDSGPLTAKIPAGTQLLVRIYLNDPSFCNVGASAGGNAFINVQYVMD